MSAADPTEVALRGLRLRLPAVGAHLSDERLACLAEGAPRTDAEAAHLAGCDDCAAVWVLLADGLAGLADDLAEDRAAGADDPAAGIGAAEGPASPAALTRPGLGARRPAPRWVWPTVLLAGVAAAALWGLRPAPPAAPEPAAAADALDVGLPLAVPDAGLPDAGVPDAAAPDAAAPDAGVPDAAAPAAAPPDPAPADAGGALHTETAGASAGAVAPTRTAPAATEPPAPRRRPIPRPVAASPASAPMRPAAPTGHGGLTGAGGQTAVARRPINGPPRGYGYLRLTAKPPARVFVDGKAVGWTPVLDYRLPEGPHDVRMVYESELAATPEQRLRVIIEADRIWKVVRNNQRRARP